MENITDNSLMISISLVGLWRLNNISV